MKKLLLLIPLAFLSITAPVQAQQVTVYQSCVGEVYFPGYYDQYGNFVQGGVSTTRVPCGGGYTTQQRICNPERTAFGALLGGSIAGAISGKGYEYGGSYYNNYGRGSNSGGWSRYDKPNYWVGMGTALGGLAYSC